MRSKRLFTPIWCVLLLPTILQAGDNQEDSFLKSIANAAHSTLELQETIRDRHALRLRSLRELHEHGFASYKELCLAEIQQATNQSNWKAASSYRDFVQKLLPKSNDSHTDANHPGEVVITIHDLDMDPRTKPIAKVVLPGDLAGDLDFLGPQLVDFSRRDAWIELENRLSDRAFDFPSAQYEITAANLEAKQAELESKLRTQSSQLKQIQGFDPVHVDGKTVVSIRQLLSICESESTRLANIARRDAAKKHIRLLAELDRRIQQAVQSDASPTLESPKSLHMLVQAEFQLQQATEALHQLGLENETDVTLVARKANSEFSPASALSSFRMDQVRQAMLQRVAKAEFDANTASQQRESAKQRFAKLSEIAATDPVFVRERKRQEILVSIADANIARQKFHHRQRELELEYFKALVENSDWKLALQNLFDHQAKSSATETYFRAVLKLDQWRAAAMEELHRQGAASWKEATATKVRLAETRSKIDFADKQKQEAQAIVRLLGYATQTSDIQ